MGVRRILAQPCRQVSNYRFEGRNFFLLSQNQGFELNYVVGLYHNPIRANCVPKQLRQINFPVLIQLGETPG